MEHNDTSQTDYRLDDERLSAERHRQRRQWSEAEKLAIVEESYSSSSTVEATARFHGISDTTLSRWRKDCREGRLGGGLSSAFVSAVVVEDMPVPAASGAFGRMEIVSANGRRVLVGSDFDASALSRLLDVLEARR